MTAAPPSGVPHSHHAPVNPYRARRRLVRSATRVTGARFDHSWLISTQVSYAAFAAALDGRVLYGDAAPQRERNPVNPEPEVPEPEPGFSAAAADAAFREGLLAAHETIARSWLALRRLQSDDRRDLSYDAFERGLDLYGVAATGGDAEAIYALYVGAPAALRRRPLAFAAFARRFADGGVLRPGLRASARAFRRAPVQ